MPVTMNPEVGAVTSFDRVHGTGAGRTPEPSDDGRSISFGDVLSALNPLQHIPGINSLYRAVTGDTISPEARVAGSILYGGPIGLAAATFEDIARHMFQGEETPAESAQLARNGSDRQDARDGVEQTAMQAERSGREPLREQTGSVRQVEPQSLTGEAALAALANDLRSGRQDPDESGKPRASGGAPPRDGAGHAESALTGEAALAALAQDLRGKGAERAARRLEQETASQGPETGAAQEISAARSPGAEATFMPIHETDINRTTPMHARSAAKRTDAARAADPLRGYGIEAAPSHEALSAKALTDDAPGAQSAGQSVPPDFASRMKEALDKYQAMHRGG